MESPVISCGKLSGYNSARDRFISININVKNAIMTYIVKQRDNMID